MGVLTSMLGSAPRVGRSSWCAALHVPAAPLRLHGSRRKAAPMRALPSSAATGGCAATDEEFMRLALAHARASCDAGEVPVGALLVEMSTGEVLASAGNCVEALHDATAHAEILCMRRAAAARQNWRLPGCALYCTLEPCPMCAAAMRSFRVSRLVYGAPSDRLGAIAGSMRSESPHPYHAYVDVRAGVLADECAAVLQDFFQRRRQEPSFGESSGALLGLGAGPDDVAAREPAPRR